MNKHRFNIFPEMEGEDYSKLVVNLQTFGFDTSQPIVVYQGDILDGWNRYRACRELGIAYSARNFHGPDSDAIQFVIRSNTRRNLTSQQRAAIAVEAYEIVEAIAVATESAKLAKQKANAANQYTEEPLGKKLPQASEDTEPVELTYEIEEKTDNRDQFKTASKLAKSFNTNRTYVQEAQKLKRDDPQKLESVKRGETTFQQIKKEAPQPTPVTDSRHNAVTDLAKEYGYKFQAAIRSFEALIEDAHKAFTSQSLNFHDFAWNIPTHDFKKVSNDAHFLKRFVKCPACKTAKCEHCKSGYVTEDKEKVVIDIETNKGGSPNA